MSTYFQQLRGSDNLFRGCNLVHPQVCTVVVGFLWMMKMKVFKLLPSVFLFTTWI